MPSPHGFQAATCVEGTGFLVDGRAVGRREVLGKGPSWTGLTGCSVTSEEACSSQQVLGTWFCPGRSVRMCHPAPVLEEVSPERKIIVAEA